MGSQEAVAIVWMTAKEGLNNSGSRRGERGQGLGLCLHRITLVKACLPSCVVFVFSDPTTPQTVLLGCQLLCTTWCPLYSHLPDFQDPHPPAPLPTRHMFPPELSGLHTPFSRKSLHNLQGSLQKLSRNPRAWNPAWGSSEHRACVVTCP